MDFSEDVLRLNPQLRGEDVSKPLKPSKYHNAKTEAAGMVFDSSHEAAGVGDLILLEEQKHIFGLRLQVRFLLAAGIEYVADAVYCEYSEKSGHLEAHVVDFKGFKTKEYRLKKKLFREKYGQDIEEL
jgi:hypothetical protein